MLPPKKLRTFSTKKMYHESFEHRDFLTAIVHNNQQIELVVKTPTMTTNMDPLLINASNEPQDVSLNEGDKKETNDASVLPENPSDSDSDSDNDSSVHVEEIVPDTTKEVYIGQNEFVKFAAKVAERQYNARKYF